MATTTQKTSSEPTQAERLATPFPDEALRELEKQGRKLTYVPVSEVIARLNSVLGVTGWSMQESIANLDGHYADWVISRVTIVATIDGVETKRIGWGGQAIKMKRGTSDPVDLGDEFKGASSDALKKAAQALGVALDLSRDEDMLALERELAMEKASPEAMEFMQTYIAGLDKDELFAMKEWFSNNVAPRSLKKKNVTVEDFEMFIADHDLVADWEAMGG